MIKIVNFKDVDTFIDGRYICYVGRGTWYQGKRVPRSVFGNPFRIGKDGTRDEVIAKYQEWINDPKQQGVRFKMYERLIDAKVLVCHCAPERCHAEEIVSILEKYKQSDWRLENGRLQRTTKG